ncbi:MAG: 4-hydroxyphenylpyruvate dioxygenase [Gammaproteobacteria bacterium]
MLMKTMDDGIETDGFEFVEYIASDTKALEDLFIKMGFTAVSHHRSKDVTLYRQGDINFIINHEPHSFASAFAQVHGPSVCAFGIRVKNATLAYERLKQLGAKEFRAQVGPMELNIPAIYGIGSSLIYIIDRYGDSSIYDVDFKPIEGQSRIPIGVGLQSIDHLTHNVHQGRMDQWAEFYERFFSFREVKYFDIRGAQTGLRSRAMVSPCGKIRIPINEPSDPKSQIQEYIEAYHGEGIQHIALHTNDIYTSVEKLRENGVIFMDVPDTYYNQIEMRIPRHGEDIDRLKENKILIDGSANGKTKLLLQIFTQTVIGPIFFEVIQRKGNEGFGEGNFQALFEAIEQDQLKRGAL